MVTKNYGATTSSMGVQFLTANQAWVVTWHGTPISIRDRMFFDDLRVLDAHLDDMGLHLMQSGAIERWCPVGRILTGFPVGLSYLPLCPNHATMDSQFCADHAHHGR